MVSQVMQDFVHPQYDRLAYPQYVISHVVARTKIASQLPPTLTSPKRHSFGGLSGVQKQAAPKGMYRGSAGPKYLPRLPQFF